MLGKISEGVEPADSKTGWRKKAADFVSCEYERFNSVSRENASENKTGV